MEKDPYEGSLDGIHWYKIDPLAVGYHLRKYGHARKRNGNEIYVFNMKKEFQPGDFARFPNEQIPRILEILKANVHPVWSSVAAWQDHHDIVVCGSDNDMMGYDSTEPKCRTEMTPHDFMTIALRLEEGMGISNESTPEQRRHVTEVLTELGINQADTLKGRDASGEWIHPFGFVRSKWLSVNETEIKSQISYLEFCRRLCVEPIEKTLEQHVDEYDAGKFDPMKPMQAFTPGAMWFDVKPENFVGFHKGYPVFWNESLHSYESYLDVRNIPELEFQKGDPVWYRNCTEFWHYGWFNSENHVKTQKGTVSFGKEMRPAIVDGESVYPPFKD